MRYFTDYPSFGVRIIGACTDSLDHVPGHISSAGAWPGGEANNHVAYHWGHWPRARDAGGDCCLTRSALSLKGAKDRWCKGQ